MQYTKEQILELKRQAAKKKAQEFFEKARQQHIQNEILRRMEYERQKALKMQKQRQKPKRSWGNKVW